MSWNERQRSMLQAMGLPVWTHPSKTPVRALTPVAAAQVPDREGANAAPNVLARPATTSWVAAAETEQRARRIAELDWPALRDAVAQCRACKLCEQRTQTVFGVGNMRAHWMIVGEAPGEQEDRRGEPFVGAAGQLLDRMLHALGLTRAPAEPGQQVYIANTLKCRPPRNRNPDAEELAMCQPFLRRQIELVQPKIILAMGRFAVQSLLVSNEAIGRLRQRLHRFNDVPLVVTYHPAYLLRNPADKARAWADLCLAASVVQG